jgi:hypothetical protein
MFKRRLATVAALGGLLAAGLALPVSQAVAAPRDGVVESGELVLWRDANYSGSIFDDPDYNDTYIGDYFVNSTNGLNDQVSALANYNLNLRVQVYDYQHCTGPYLSVLRYGQVSGSASWAYTYPSMGGFNDILSSHQFLP